MSDLDRGTMRVVNGTLDPTAPARYWPNGNDFLEECANAEIEWLWDGLVPAVGITFFGGNAMAGKTRLVNGLVAARSGPGELAGRKVKRGHTTLLSLEHSSPSIARGLLEAQAGAGLKQLDFSIIRTPPSIDLADPLQFSYIMEQIEARGSSLVVVDSTRRAMHGEEDKSGDVAAFMRSIQTIAADVRAVILLHHLAKNTGSLRGSGDLKAGCDSAVYFTKGQNGIVRLRAEHHDAEEVELTLKAHHFGGQLRFTEAEGGEAAGSVDDMQGRVQEFANQHPEGFGKRDLREGVPGGNEAVDAALQACLDAKTIMSKWGGSHRRFFPAP